MTGVNTRPRERDALRILITDDSPESQAAENALRGKNLFFIKEESFKEAEEVCKAPCLIAGEGRFSGKQMIEGYAATIDEHIKNGW